MADGNRDTGMYADVCRARALIRAWDQRGHAWHDQSWQRAGWTSDAEGVPFVGGHGSDTPWCPMRLPALLASGYAPRCTWYTDLHEGHFSPPAPITSGQMTPDDFDTWYPSSSNVALCHPPPTPITLGAASSSAVAAPSSAVAAAPAALAASTLAAPAGNDSDHDCLSIVGDNMRSESECDAGELPEVRKQRGAIADAARRLKQEELTQASIKHASTEQPPRQRSAKKNMDHAVGNFGLFTGNWGLKGTIGKSEEQRNRMDAQDRQILKNPGQVVVLVEANEDVEILLRSLPQEEDLNRSRGINWLSGRPTHEHWVIRGNEDAGILIASRKDNTDACLLLHNEVFHAHEYKEKSVRKMAKDRIMVAKVNFKQNVGHIGKDVVVMGVHGNFRTMKIEWRDQWNAFWDRMAAYVGRYGVNFIAGDFNMSLTEVPNQLSSRGVVCECVAWYPWRLKGEPAGQTNEAIADLVSCQPLGLDSMGIFFVGGNVKVKMDWDFNKIYLLSAVADDRGMIVPGRPCMDLTEFEGYNVPGQVWTAYRSKKYAEKVEDKDLEARLTDLLMPSTTQAELDAIQRTEGSRYCPHLKLKSRILEVDEWLVNGQVHNGAHMPLAMWTDNESARSEAAAKARATKARGKKWKGIEEGKQRKHMSTGERREM